MPVDFEQVNQKIKKIGQTAPEHNQAIRSSREAAGQLLDKYADDIDRLQRKVQQAAENDSYLRCASPVSEALNAIIPVPPLPGQATILAADGSQINPDRHAPIEYYLINIGAIEICLGSPTHPETFTITELHAGPELYRKGIVTESDVSLERDLKEREVLAAMAQKSAKPILTLTDGPIELWGSKGNEIESGTFKNRLDDYIKKLRELNLLQVATAGYVDKPRADMVVQLLEIAETPSNDLHDIRKKRKFLGVTDIDLYRGILKPGDRSAIFAIQSRSIEDYTDELALHFFYLNVGSPKKPWLARVEVPAWVVHTLEMLNNLHAVIYQQCHIMGTRTFPYILHRAHEIAVVTLQEQEQITKMLLQELRDQNVEINEESQKQASKKLTGRRRFKLGRQRI